MVLAAFCILISATASTVSFMGGVSGLYLAVQVPSLMVHIYSENYRSDERGQKISGNLMISAVVEV